MRFVLPVGLAQLQPDQAKAVFLKCRRVFKISIHASILFLLISGAYNAWANWGRYHEGIPLSHAFFGTHLLLGLMAIVLSLVILAPKDPPPSHRNWAAVNFVILLAAVAAAGCLKWKRDHTPSAAGPPTSRP